MLHARLGSGASPGVARACGSSSGVEHHVANVAVEGSNPFSRSCIDTVLGRRLSLERGIVRDGGPSHSGQMPLEGNASDEHRRERTRSIGRGGRMSPSIGRSESRAQAEARAGGRDHRCRPVQEALEDHDSAFGDRPAIRGIARVAAEGRGRFPGFGRAGRRGS